MSMLTGAARVAAMGAMMWAGAAGTVPPPAPPVQASLMAPVLRVADCAKVQSYYESVLGMTAIMSRVLGPVREIMLAFAGEPAKPAIMIVCNASPAAAPQRGTGGGRLIIAVTNLDSVVARLDGAGMAHPAVQMPVKEVRVLNLRDPEQNELELVQMIPATIGARP